MNLHYFLSSLYDNERSSFTGLVDGPTNMISKSVYSKDYKYDKRNAILIHSGFSFELSFDTTMELYYDLTNNLIVRQKKIENNLQTLGIVYRFSDTYISRQENRHLSFFNSKTNETIFTKLDSVGNRVNELTLVILAGSNEYKYRASNYHFKERVLFLDGFDYELVNKIFATKRELNQAIAEFKRDQSYLDEGEREMDSWEENFGEWR